MTKAEELHLPALKVLNPCPREWENMAGDARERHCSACGIQVYNFVEMNRGEIVAVLGRQSQERICARLLPMAGDEFVTNGAAKVPSVRYLVKLASAALAAVMSTAVANPQTSPANAPPRNQQSKLTGISVVVRDPTGAVVPNTHVIIQTVKGVTVREGVTTEDGSVEVVDLAPGHYLVLFSFKNGLTVYLEPVRVMVKKYKVTHFEQQAGLPVMGTIVEVKSREIKPK